MTSASAFSPMFPVRALASRSPSIFPDLFRGLVVLACLALAACATTGKKLAELPEPVTVMNIVVDEHPRMGWRDVDERRHARMDQRLGQFMTAVAKTIGFTFGASSTQVSVNDAAARAPYALVLKVANVSTYPVGGEPTVGIVRLDATLVHLASQTAVWSYLLEVDGNPARFSAAKLQPLADAMLAEKVLPARATK